MRTELLTSRGGEGEPIVLVHGLMGRGSTWSRQLPWLTGFGRGVHLRRAVAPRPRRRRPASVSTERFVADLADAVADARAARRR